MTMCETVRESVSAWLDGELEPELEADVLKHTDGCEECRSFLDACRIVSEDLRLDPVPVPETLIPGVMNRLAEERQSAGFDPDRRRTRRRVAAWVCAAACLALVILAGPWNWGAGSSAYKADIAASDAIAPAEAKPAVNGADEPAEMADEAVADGGWASDDAMESAADKSEKYDMDYAEADTEETMENEAVPAEEPADDFTPRADSAGELLGDYAAVITVEGEIPEGVLALSEGEELLPEGVAWLIPAEKADDLMEALSEAGSYEWLTGNEETSSWLLVRTAGN